MHSESHKGSSESHLSSIFTKRIMLNVLTYSSSDFIELKEKNMISKMSPKSMTAEDVRVIILDAKERVSTADLVHEVNALRKLLMFVDNNAVDVCLNHNLGLKPVFKGTRRKQAMQDDMTN